MVSAGIGCVCACRAERVSSVGQQNRIAECLLRRSPPTCAPTNRISKRDPAQGPFHLAPILRAFVLVQSLGVVLDDMLRDTAFRQVGRFSPDGNASMFPKSQAEHARWIMRVGPGEPVREVWLLRIHGPWYHKIAMTAWMDFCLLLLCNNSAQNMLHPIQSSKLH